MPIGKSKVVSVTAPAPVSAKLVASSIADVLGETDNVADQAKSGISVTQVSASPNSHAVSAFSQKDNNILVQGITQAVLASPGVAGLGYTNQAEFIETVESVARHMIKFVRAEQEKL